MQAARVAIFEHDRSARDVLRGAVNVPAIGHSVVSEAPSIGVALHVISLMNSGHKEIDAVILGPNLTTGEEDRRDALVLSGRLRALRVTPKIIGFASVPMAELGVAVDADISRADLLQGTSQVSKLLSSL